MVQLAERHETYAVGFEAFRADPAFGVHGLAAAREGAFERFLANGFPSTRDEEWRFTPLGPLAALTCGRAPADGVDAAVAARLATTAAPIVVVNGRLAAGPPRSLPAGVSLRTLRTARPGELLPGRPAGATVFADLNTAFFEDVVVIEIAPRTIVADPIEVLFVSRPGDEPALVSPRLMILAGEQAQASVIETYADAGAGVAFVNAVTDVHVAPGAVLDHVKLQRQGATSFHLGEMFVRVERAGQCRSTAVTLGGRIARNDIVSVLNGEGAECTLNGLYVAGGDALVDTHTTIDHAQPHCPSHEVYKGILTGHARAVFNGKIIVRPDAQKTDAKQTNKALLLSDDAQINTKPQLEIFADDVKCTHGAAVGQIDEDAMFYLKARGIGSTEARNMLIHAFAGEVLDGIRAESVRLGALALVERALDLPA